jgi:hypothetical protein
MTLTKAKWFGFSVVFGLEALRSNLDSWYLLAALAACGVCLVIGLISK